MRAKRWAGLRWPGWLRPARRSVLTLLDWLEASRLPRLHAGEIYGAVTIAALIFAFAVFRWLTA